MIKQHYIQAFTEKQGRGWGLLLPFTLLSGHLLPQHLLSLSTYISEGLESFGEFPLTLGVFCCILGLYNKTDSFEGVNPDTP